MKFQYLILLVTLSLTGCATISKLLEDSPELSSNWDNPGASGSESASAPAAEEPRSYATRKPAESEVEEAQRLQQMQLNYARQERDLIIGMSMSDVLSIWGEPRDVETAGRSASGNQRWTYFEGLSSRWSMSAARMVYFEQGRVVGWETR